VDSVSVGNTVIALEDAYIRWRFGFSCGSYGYNGFLLYFSGTPSALAGVLPTEEMNHGASYPHNGVIRTDPDTGKSYVIVSLTATNGVADYCCESFLWDFYYGWI
jgi:hypothetical protein